MSGHTPGPWVARGMAVFEDGKTALSVATVTHYQPGARDNARLIAAAPDLLEALKGLIGFFEGDDKADWTAARAAIAKAEGRT